MRMDQLCIEKIVYKMPRKSNSKATKATLKFLANCKNPKLSKEILSSSPDTVFKQLCNICLNAQRGDVCFSKRQKQILAPHRDFISNLTSTKIPLVKKKQAILHTQQGNGFLSILPAILGPVIGTIGSLLFGKKNE